MIELSTIEASANLVVERNKILLIEEQDPLIEGRWNFPGGMREPGESLIDCAIREGKEETGLTLKPVGFLCLCQQPKCQQIGGRDLTMIVFESQAMGGKLTNSKAQWFTSLEIERMSRKGKLVHPYILYALKHYAETQETNLNNIMIYPPG